jgi:TatD DNase family protein
VEYLNIHTHRELKESGVTGILSLSLTGNGPFTMPVAQQISVGLHPWHAKIANLEADFVRLEQIAKTTRVKMIGECGLDRLRGENLSDQLIILKRQLSLADTLSKPVILHCVKCFDELMVVQKEMNLNIPLIIHGFNKRPELGRQLLYKGFYLSFGPAILNADSGAATLLQELDLFFLETDDADCNIQEIYQAAAKIKKCTVPELKAVIFDNWKKINLI